jgi:hypothetical protein
VNVVDSQILSPWSTKLVYRAHYTANHIYLSKLLRSHNEFTYTHEDVRAQLFLSVQVSMFQCNAWCYAVSHNFIITFTNITVISLFVNSTIYC